MLFMVSHSFLIKYKKLPCNDLMNLLWECEVALQLIFDIEREVQFTGITSNRCCCSYLLLEYFNFEMLVMPTLEK